MSSKTSFDDREKFAYRLRDSLRAANCPMSATAVARAYNLRAGDAVVSTWGARKWLDGEAYPTQEKLVILANWLNVDAAWLRFGQTDFLPSDQVFTETKGLSTEQIILIRDIASLPDSTQLVIRDIVNSLLVVFKKDLD